MKTKQKGQWSQKWKDNLRKREPQNKTNSKIWQPLKIKIDQNAKKKYEPTMKIQTISGKGGVKSQLVSPPHLVSIYPCVSILLDKEV